MDMPDMDATHGEQMSAALAPATAGVAVEVVAPAPSVAAPVPLRYRFTDAASGAPITDIVESHERPLHLIVVSRGLAAFQHVHPTPTGQPGEFALPVIFPAPGSYLLFAEFTRADGRDIVQRDELTVDGTSGPARLIEDRSPKTAEGVRVSLAEPNMLRAGAAAALTFRLEDAATGAGIRDLQPYLAAPAHVVILSEDGQTFAHTHGEQLGTTLSGHAGHGGAPAAYGPDIAFHHTFPSPGLYKVWGQFQTREGRVITADFVVRAQ